MTWNSCPGGELHLGCIYWQLLYCDGLASIEICKDGFKKMFTYSGFEVLKGCICRGVPVPCDELYLEKGGHPG